MAMGQNFEEIVARMPRTPGLHNLKPEVLLETKNDLISLGLSEAVEMGLAQRIITDTLGANFWHKECVQFKNRQPFMKEKTNVIMVHLAHMLWRVKDVPGFVDFLTRTDLKKIEGAYYELYATTLFDEPATRLRFIKPQSQKGSDFDLEISNFRNFNILNVEIKAKNQILLDRTAVIRKLEKARGQLPEDGAGAIVMKIKISDRAINQTDLDKATLHFLSNTDRVKFVTYISDQSQFDNSRWMVTRTLNRDGHVEDMFPYIGWVKPSFLRDLAHYEAELLKT